MTKQEILDIIKPASAAAYFNTKDSSFLYDQLTKAAEEIYRKINQTMSPEAKLIQDQISLLDSSYRGTLSDGYHTFNELYEHRIVNYIALCRSLEKLKNVCRSSDHEVWRSQAHSNGAVWDGWLILGINKEPGKQITYHLPMTKWNDCAFAETLDKAPEFDGHTSEDVLKRLSEL